MLSIHRRFLSGWILVVIACMVVLARSAAAQERPAPVVEAGGGGFMSLAEDAGDGFVGAAARFYVSPRVSIGPEILFFDELEDRMLRGNVMFDLLPPVRGRALHIAPFIASGAGVIQRRRKLPSGATFGSTESALDAGGGVRVLLWNRAFFGVETRITSARRVRLNLLVGIHIPGL